MSIPASKPSKPFSPYILDKNEDQRKQFDIHLALRQLKNLPRVSLTVEYSDTKEPVVIYLKHPQEYFPDFKLEWCPVKKHYRVYILVASTTHGKEKAGYCICTIGSGLSAMGFAVMYMFIHKHRANNKGAAE